MFFIYQGGFEGVWVKTITEAVSYICALFGLDFLANCEKLYAQIETIQRGCALKHKDLSLFI